MRVVIECSLADRSVYPQLPAAINLDARESGCLGPDLPEP